MIQIDILENNKGDHDDLLFSIAGLIERQVFVTYYFILAIEPKTGLSQVKKAVAQLLKYWEEKIQTTKGNDTIYLPIDFSDEWTGCLKVRRQNEALVLAYGRSGWEGDAVSPLNPEDYYTSVVDFFPISPKTVTVAPQNLLASIKQLKEKLAQ